jgi:ferric enterobactin receptor
MKVFTGTFLILLTSLICVEAQTITGSIADLQTRQPLAYCSVALFKSQDSTLVTGLLTTEKGFFKFENVLSGEYYLKTQYMGYSQSTVSVPAFSAGQNMIEVPLILMNPYLRTLQQVNVIGERQTLENRVDRQVYRADKFLASQGGQPLMF